MTTAGRPAEVPNSKFQIPNKFKILNLTWKLELETWNAREARFARSAYIFL
jgi:hypothetical protein